MDKQWKDGKMKKEKKNHPDSWEFPRVKLKQAVNYLYRADVNSATYVEPLRFGTSKSASCS